METLAWERQRNLAKVHKTGDANSGLWGSIAVLLLHVADVSWGTGG